MRAQATLTPHPMSPASVENIKVLEECAECLLCTAYCPAYAKVEGYAGPMTFVKIAKFGFDHRDQVNRLAEAARGKVFECVSCFRCEEACPHEIPVRHMAISALRRALAGGKAVAPTADFPQARAAAAAEEGREPFIGKPTIWERLIGTPGSLRDYETGMWAWLLNRVTGWLLALYLLVHLGLIGFAAIRSGTFDDVMDYLSHPAFLALDLILLGILLFHALNGLRLILADYWPGVNHKALFWVAVGITVAGMAVSGPIFFGVLG